MMRPTNWIPSVVPDGADQPVYLVADDFNRHGRVFRETEVERTDLETVIADLVSGQYNDPISVVAFNTAEHWAEDVSEDVAREIRHRADLANEDLPSAIEAHSDAHSRRQLQLPLRLV